jgi:hypothetical protein
MAGKSSAEGIDLEFDRDSIRYIVSIKSGQLGNANNKAIGRQFQGGCQNSETGTPRPSSSPCWESVMAKRELQITAII